MSELMTVDGDMDGSGQRHEEPGPTEPEIAPAPEAEVQALLREAALSAIRDAGLFDEGFYLATYRDVAESDLTPAKHFFDYGYDEGRLPNAYFDPDWYLNNNNDVREAAMQPLLHYVQYGDAEGRRPGPFFDTVWYRHTNSVPAGQNALGHYLQHARSCSVSPLPEFDAAFYCKRNADVCEAGIDPFLHFLNHGFREGRNPSAAFDTRFYANRYCGGSMTENPFLHYLAHKA